MAENMSEESLPNMSEESLPNMTEESLPLSTTSPTQPVRLRMGESGYAARPPITVMEQFSKTVKKYKSKPALHQKVIKPGSSASDTAWTTWSWDEYSANVDAFAKSLIAVGFECFDTVNIVGFNSPEWLFANMAAIAAGGMGAGIYASNNASACEYITNHSKAKVVVVEGTHQLQKYIDISSNISSVKAIVMYGTESVPEGVEGKCSIPVHHFDDFVKLGKEVSDADLQARKDSHKANTICTLIYTSGTTGPPKAVMLTNDNITYIGSMSGIFVPRPLTPDDRIISYLPLSHIAAQTLDIYMGLYTGIQCYFAQSDALKGSLGATLKEVRPAMFFGVPRVWEKIYDKMQIIAKSTTGVKKKLGAWAKSKSTKHSNSLQYGSTKTSPSLYFFAEKILSQIRLALGLDRCLVCLTGAAPIEEKILRYFASIGVPILELFGQSECTGPHTVNKPGAWKLGTCGRPIPGTESKIADGTGELCYRGRHIFAGYMGMEDKTAEAIDSEGWLHSGDVVKFDEDNDPEIPTPSGFMTIVGRIKEIIITAGGENIAPVLIEQQFKVSLPALSNCMVIGDKRKFLTILLCLQVEINEDGVPSDKLSGISLNTSKDLGSDALTTGEAGKCDKWKAYFDEGMKEANVKAISRAQNVGKWALLPSDFSEQGGELTPTLKLKRKNAADKYSTVVEELYK